MVLKTASINFGPRTMDSSANRAPSLHGTIVIQTVCRWSSRWHAHMHRFIEPTIEQSANPDQLALPRFVPLLSLLYGRNISVALLYGPWPSCVPSLFGLFGVYRLANPDHFALPRSLCCFHCGVDHCRSVNVALYYWPWPMCVPSLFGLFGACCSYLSNCSCFHKPFISFNVSCFHIFMFYDVSWSLCLHVFQLERLDWITDHWSAFAVRRPAVRGPSTNPTWMTITRSYCSHWCADHGRDVKGSCLWACLSWRLAAAPLALHLYAAVLHLYFDDSIVCCCVASLFLLILLCCIRRKSRLRYSCRSSSSADHYPAQHARHSHVARSCIPVSMRTFWQTISGPYTTKFRISNTWFVFQCSNYPKHYLHDLHQLH